MPELAISDALRLDAYESAARNAIRYANRLTAIVPAVSATTVT